MGYSGFWAKRELEPLGFKTLVVNPTDISTSDKDRVFKTNKGDSRKNLVTLRSGKLEKIYCTTGTVKRNRAVLHARAQTTKS